MGSAMRQRSIGTRPDFNTGAALRLIDLVQDAVQLLLGQDVKIHQRIQLDSHHHGYRGSTILLFFRSRLLCGFDCYQYSPMVLPIPSAKVTHSL